LEYVKRSIVFMIAFWLGWHASALIEVFPHISALYIPPGFSVAFVALFGWRFIPVVFLSAILTSSPNLLEGNFGAFSVIHSLVHAVAYGIAGCYFSQIWAKQSRRFSLNTSLTFTTLSLAASLTSAVAAYYIFSGYELVPVEALGSVFFSFWWGDFAGVMLTTPLLLTSYEFFSKPASSLKRFFGEFTADTKQSLLFISCILLPVAMRLLSYFLGIELELNLLVLVPITLIAMLFGVSSGILATLLACGSVLTLPGFYITEINNAIELQVLLGLCATSALIAGALHEDRERENETRFQANIIKTMMEGVVLVQLDSAEIVYANPKFEEMFGYEPEEMNGKPGSILNAGTEEEKELTAQTILAEINKMGGWKGEIQNIRKNGTTFWCYATVKIMNHPEYGFVAVSIHNDITDRKLAELRQKDSEDKYRDLINASPVCIHEIDLEGKITSMNPAGLKMMGVDKEESVCGLKYLDVPIADDRKRVGELMERARKGEGSSFEFKAGEGEGLMHFSSSFEPITDDDGSVIKLMGMTQNITGRKQLEQQLRQSQRMEVVGELTGGIAHDFNNLMAIMMGNLEAALDKAHRNVEFRDNIENALGAVERGAALTQQLLSFSRQQSLSPSVASVNELVADTLKFLERTLGENIKIVAEYFDDELPVYIDAAIFGNALVNIALNARDAMPGDGTLTIQTTLVELNNEVLGADREPVSGSHVLITIADTGAGIGENDLNHVLEPFFTTKEVGQGSGLGLSMVYGFVTQSNGHMHIASKKGEGTTISLYFPITDEVQEVSKGKAPFPNVHIDKKILLVEDDQLVRETTSATLVDLGYNVIEAEDGPSALDIIRELSNEIDLVFTDVVMPNNMSGVELAKMIASDHRGIKVLLTSGYPDRIADQDDIKALGVELLAKPYTRAQLAVAIEKITFDKPKE
jgi:PAS domain S-box-containing protein